MSQARWHLDMFPKPVISHSHYILTFSSGGRGEGGRVTTGHRIFWDHSVSTFFLSSLWRPKEVKHVKAKPWWFLSLTQMVFVRKTKPEHKQVHRKILNLKKHKDERYPWFAEMYTANIHSYYWVDLILPFEFSGGSSTSIDVWPVLCHLSYAIL